MPMQQRHQRGYRSSLCAVAVLVLAALVGGVAQAAPVAAATRPAPAPQAVQNFLGHPPADAVSALGAKAKFVDDKFNAIAASAAQGVIVWQSPLPTQPASATGEVQLLAANNVPMPAIEGMRVSDARTLMLYRGLVLEVVASCGAKGYAPQEDELDWRVTHQCVAPNDVLTVGGHVGVVIQPWPDDGISAAAAFAIGALAGLAAGAALIFFMRRRGS